MAELPEGEGAVNTLATTPVPEKVPVFPELAGQDEFIVKVIKEEESNFQPND